MTTQTQCTESNHQTSFLIGPSSLSSHPAPGQPRWLRTRSQLNTRHTRAISDPTRRPANWRQLAIHNRHRLHHRQVRWRVDIEALPQHKNFILKQPTRAQEQIRLFVGSRTGDAIANFQHLKLHSFVLLSRLAGLEVHGQDVVYINLAVFKTADLLDETDAEVIAGRGLEVAGCFVVVDFVEAVFEFEFADEGHCDEVCAGARVAFGPHHHFFVVAVADDQGDVGVVAGFLGLVSAQLKM